MKPFCQNTKCYITDKPLSQNEAEEHIIPNALGGHLKSRRLVLTSINTELFDKLDAELARRIEISKLVNFKRDRGVKPFIIGTGSDGFQYLVNSNRTGKLLPIKPIEYVDVQGKKFSKFPLTQKNEIISARLKKNPHLTKEEIETSIKEEFEDKCNEMDYEFGLNIIANSKDSFRAIAKIATNYAVLNNINKNEFLDFIDFIKGGGLEKIKLGYFYPQKRLNYDLSSNELSHILYLKGCSKENLLYCYIELFNTHCFIVILNENYNGHDINENYIWDLVNAKELNKPISMNLSRDFLLSRSYMYYQEVESDYAIRLRRLNKICHLKIKFN